MFIMSSFDFDKYGFKALTVERPGDKLHDLLIKNGYVFVKNNGGHGDQLWINTKYMDLAEVYKVLPLYRMEGI